MKKSYEVSVKRLEPENGCEWTDFYCTTREGALECIAEWLDKAEKIEVRFD